MTERHAVWTSALLATFAIVALWTFGNTDASFPARPMAYVVCGDDRFQDNRVYRVDLRAGKLKGISDPIGRLGNPAHLAYDPVFSRLYVASMAGRSAGSYWPVTVIRVGNGEFEVTNRFTTTTKSADNSSRGANAGRGRNGPYEAYVIVVSPDGNELYVMHGGLARSKFLTAVWNAHTGETLRLLPTGISSENRVWSPDGNYLVQRWPSQEREEEEDGQGGMSVRNTQTGQKVTTYLENGEGMHPPWGRINEPFIYFSPRERGVVRVYDRDTGEIISEFDIQELTGLQLQSSPMGDRSSVLKGGRLLAVAMRTDQSQRLWDGNEAGWDYPSYIVLIDVLEQREITRTQVGLRCSNAVVAYE